MFNFGNPWLYQSVQQNQLPNGFKGPMQGGLQQNQLPGGFKGPMQFGQQRNPFGFAAGGAPSGFLPPPAGVPFAHSPYTAFGSPFGLGLGLWNSGLGVGPQFPENLWNRPTQEQSPQSPVTPAPDASGAATPDGSWEDFTKAYWRGRYNRSQGSETPLADPTYGQYQNWLSNPSATLMWR